MNIKLLTAFLKYTQQIVSRQLLNVYFNVSRVWWNLILRSVISFLTFASCRYGSANAEIFLWNRLLQFRSFFTEKIILSFVLIKNSPNWYYYEKKNANFLKTYKIKLSCETPLFIIRTFNMATIANLL